MSKKTPTVCYHCAKPIAGKCTSVVPSILTMRLLGAAVRSYHPSCYRVAEKQAAQELGA